MAANRTSFVKGDPRINRKGRPKTSDAFRSLAQQIAHEAALKNGEPLVIDGHIVTVTEAILRQWAQSKDPRLQMAFIEVAYGKVPVRTELTGKNGEPMKLQTENLSDEEIISELKTILDARAESASDSPDG